MHGQANVDLYNMSFPSAFIGPLIPFYNLLQYTCMYYVYILSNKTNSTLYIGITNNLVRRVWQHQNKFVPGFTNDYNVQKLVYYELYPDVIRAIEREKQLKTWHRDWKERLIATLNPSWDDLYHTICHK